ncbi:hypothetical protein JCM30471_27880 [Desulfuromonas carbonis]|uniref:signal peptidase I n=1 Tax=Desulfuromonas sp. DDH964 TaxID=1823759 RepID=UPI00078CD112|nr:signal peptidase I [Desulfuromonas sp. DDH964]AMV70970.1 signal peptidase I [Desulfuromonas sp. DDH964]
MTEVAIDSGQGPRRKVWVAVLLSLALSGLGQLYTGQLRKAVLFLLVSTLVPLLFVLRSGQTPTLAAVVTLLMLQALIQLAALVDASRAARRIGSSFHPTWYNRVPVYLGTYLLFGLLLSGAISWYLRTQVVEAFTIASSSMEPTLLLGDRILVAKGTQDFTRGDLVVFDSPPDQGKAGQREFIKRIVGMPGDVVEVRDKELFINGRQLLEPYAVHLEADTLSAEVSPRDFFGPVTVPAQSYFMLGDNRDRSYDSRFWGFVEKEKVLGRAVNFYWSWDRRQHEVRWERIGVEIGKGGVVNLVGWFSKS